MKNKLILFTAEFPYGNGETFLETEILYLSAKFEEVVIVSQGKSDVLMRKVPENVRVETMDLSMTFLEKIKSLNALTNQLFKEELQIIKKVYRKKLSKGIISTMLISIFRANQVKKWVSDFIRDKTSNEKLFFYSYWCDDVALGLAMIQKEHQDVVCVSRMHGWDIYFEASSLNYLPYRHAIASGLSKIFAISQKGVEYARTTWKLEVPDKVVVSRLGVPEQSIVEPGVTPVILVSCSNVIPLKRVDLIVKALQSIRVYPIHWVHFGDGPQLEKVIIIAKELPSNIHSEFKGRVSNKEVLQWYRENNPHLFINVSSTEGIPVSIMEAMSFGIPVIATNVGGISEIVNEDNGKLVPSNISAIELVDILIEFIADPELLNQRSKGAHLTWKNGFNSEMNYKKFAELLISI